MIDSDVMRLRHLRNTALRARALAHALESNSTADNAIFERSAALCWAVARIATGQLRAHPYLAYQQGPSTARGMSDRAIAAMIAFAARHRGRNFSALAQELQSVARSVADTRALARLPDLSDSLGRTQLQLRRLAEDLGSRARSEGADAIPRIHARVQVSGRGVAAQTDWPYLAI